MNMTNQPVNRVEAKAQTPAQPIDNQKFNPLVILGILALLLIVGGGGCRLVAQDNSNIQSSNIRIPTHVQSVVAPTQMPAEPSLIKIITEDGKVAYEHPVLHYTLEYPASWKGETIPKSIGEEWYEDFYAQSSDYRYQGIELTKGSSFNVRVKNTDEKTIDDVFSKEPIAVRTAKNKAKTTVDGAEAIQYDFNWEGVNANITEFLKNGRHYSIQYKYVDISGKQARWDIYQNFLKSFKAI